MKLYLAGPMTGIPEHNYPEFRRLAAIIRAAGHELQSPVELNEELGFTANPDGTISVEDLALCFERDIHAILWCEGIVLMSGWASSSSARVEAQLGAKLNKRFFWAETMQERGTPVFVFMSWMCQ